MNQNQFTILVLIVFCLNIVLGSGVVDGLTAEEWKHKGDDAFKAKMFDVATTNYGKAIEADPENYLNYYQRGLVYSFRGRPTFAIRDFDSVLNINPTHISSLTKRAQLYIELGSVEEARKDLDKLNELKPNSQTVSEGLLQIETITQAVNKAHKAEEQGNHFEAAQAWSNALSVARSSESFLVSRVKNQLELHEYENVLSDAVRILRLNPKNMDGFWYQGEASFHLRDFSSALEAYKRALKFDPENTKVGKAIKLVKKVNKNYEALNEAFNHDQWNEFISSWDELEKIYPAIVSDTPMAVKKAQAFVKVRKPKDAIQICNQILSRDEKSVDAMLWKAEAHLVLDEFQEARQELQKARQEAPNDQRIMEAQQRLEKKEKMALRKDYYKILGVPRDADEKVIKKAYRNLAKEFHPDKHKEEEDKEAAQAKFLDITEAYEVLNDPEARDRYDRGEDINPPKQHNPFQGFPGGFGGFPGGFKFHFH